jgi:hypothetical protein
MPVINNIQNALNARLASVSGLPTVYWPNVDNEPAQGTNWVRPTLLPARGELFTLNNENMHEGIYQVDIFTSLKKGTSPLWTIADAVRDHFKAVDVVTSSGANVFIQEISFSQARRIESWWSCYVEIRYLCFV